MMHASTLNQANKTGFVVYIIKYTVRVIFSATLATFCTGKYGKPQKEEIEKASRKRKLASDSLEASNRGRGQQSIIAQAFGTANKGELGQADARCLIANGLPFHLLRSKYYAKMLTAVGKIGSYRPPGPETCIPGFWMLRKQEWGRSCQISMNLERQVHPLTSVCCCEVCRKIWLMSSLQIWQYWTAYSQTLS